MPLSQIIVLCFSMTLWRNGTPGLENQLITWIVPGKWTMTEERDWIPIGCHTDCLFVLRCWLSCHILCPLCQTNMCISPLDWYSLIYHISKSIQACTGHVRNLLWFEWERAVFLSNWATNSELGVNWGLDPIISLSLWVFVRGWVYAWLQSLLRLWSIPCDGWEPGLRVYWGAKSCT